MIGPIPKHFGEISVFLDIDWASGLSRSHTPAQRLKRQTSGLYLESASRWCDNRAMNQLQLKHSVAIVLVSLILSAQAKDAGDGELTIDQASHQAITERVAEMLYLTPWLPAAAIQDQIDAVISDQDLSEPAREKILRDYAYQLRDQRPDAVAMGSLQYLATYPSTVMVIHPESRGSKRVPVYDIASAAKGTINQWLRESSRARAAAELEQGAISFFYDLTESAHYQQIAGVADAVRLAPSSAVELLIEPLFKLLPQSPQLTPVVLAASYRLQNEDLLRLAIRHGDNTSRAINTLLDFVPARLAGTILFELAAGSDLQQAGLAIAALARHASSIEGVGEFLIAKMADQERGAAAALALAQIDSPRVLGDLAAVLKRPPDSLSQTRAALALKLNGSEPAMALLRDFAAQQQSGKLSGEVQQWLQ